MAHKGTYPFPSTRNGTGQLFSSCRLATAVPRELDRLYAQLASPPVTFTRSLLGNDKAL